jgi:hypothetical protein
MAKNGNRDLKSIAKQASEVRVTFKKNQREQKLKRWLFNHASPSAFLKDLAFKAMDAELKQQPAGFPAAFNPSIIREELDYDPLK